MPPAVQARLREARVGRLGTIDPQGRPHLVPICYAFDGEAFYTAIDAKPKPAQGKELTRVRNLQADPRVSLLVDHYEEDWSRLWFVLVRGKGELLPEGDLKQRAVSLLQEKYVHYREGWLPARPRIIQIRPERVTWWGAL